MDFVGTTMVALTDPDAAANLISPAEGLAILQATFDLSRVDVQTVDAVAVRRTDLAAMTPESYDAEFTLSAVGGGPTWEGRGRVLGQEALAGFDAQMRLAVATSTRQSQTEVTDVRTSDLKGVFQMAAVDARILADDGILPADPEALEARRRESLLALLLDAFIQPEDWDADDFLRLASSTTVAELIAANNPPGYSSRMEVDLVIDPDLEARTLDFLLDVFVLVNARPLDDLPGLIDRIRGARGPAARSVSQPGAPHGVTFNQKVPVMVICDEESFEDDDLPIPAGAVPANADAARTARQTELNRRFAGAGIVFATP